MEKDARAKLKVLRVDGGGSQNALLMQMQADFMGRVVERPMMVDTTSIGAAFLAGLGVGLWKDLSQIRKVWKTSAKFNSRIGSSERQARLSEWQGAVKRALSQAK
jgi:glycerol kinase